MATEKAILAAGPATELAASFQGVGGVIEVITGFTGGATDNPTAEDVAGDRTGHAEAILITFDPDVVSYGELLDVFFGAHDPTTRNRQGESVGTRFRSAVFPTTKEQERIARQCIRELDDAGEHVAPVVTEVAPARIFHPYDTQAHITT
jgi:peptide-methionine (S)-S-oxide reductase